MTGPIKALFVMQKLVGLTGGAERVLIETARAMAARGMEVRIVTFDTREGEPGYDTGGVPVESLFPRRRPASTGAAGHAGRAERLVKAVPNVFPVTHLKWQVTHGFFARRLRRHVRRHRPDVVVAFLPPAITAAAFALRGLGVPLIASTHNVPDQDFGLVSPRWDQNPLYRRRALAALAMAARVTVLLPEFAKGFAPEVQAKIVVMPNPVARLAPPVPGAARGPVILGVGRLTAIKRWDLLIDAFAACADRLPDWQVRIFGEGPEEPALRDRIAATGMAGRVTLAGTTRRIAEEYDRAAMLCHPSEFEGFGLSVAEAMVHGLPPVAYADCPGVNRLITDGGDGLLVPRGPDPVASLAAGIERLAGDPALRDRLGQAATGLARRFDADTIHDAWAALLTTAAGR